VCRFEPVPGTIYSDTSGQPFGTVEWLALWPYPAYTRIFHPVPLVRGADSTTWSRVALDTGHIAHGGMQFQNIAGSSLGDRYNNPVWADMGARAFSALVADLGAAGPNGCYLALWDGHTWVSVAPGDNAGADSETVGVDSGAWEKAGRLNRPPGRVYRLFQSAVSDVAHFGTWRAGPFFVPAQPTYMWADDRSWCVATDPDYDSTIVGGAVDLQTALIGDPTLEAMAVSSEQSLLFNADDVNA
jgi:hypothetical protein